MKLTVGGPHTGKTTRAKDARHQDELGTRGDHTRTNERINTVAEWIRSNQDSEGVFVAHALRRVLRDDPQRSMAGVTVEHLHTPYGALTPGQQALAKAVKTIMDEIRPEIERRGGTVIDVR